MTPLCVCWSVPHPAAQTISGLTPCTECLELLDLVNDESKTAQFKLKPGLPIAWGIGAAFSTGDRYGAFQSLITKSSHPCGIGRHPIVETSDPLAALHGEQIGKRAFRDPNIS
ncbi:hypothetical protein CLCR_07737 [Cladophialophora carrionii]|uniref:Uncharacterized protein n=1 Tax=Cladophialophora carrionii TaxID=86049 RepID=A0A1C1CP27_9EURO|nr:hypothetical protein CLCR_07737 [Cladophialophora carrionii]